MGAKGKKQTQRRPDIPVGTVVRLGSSVGLVEGVGRWMPPLAEIDVVGIDGYAQTPDQSFGDVFGPSIHALRGLAPGKPLAICETACPRGPKQRRWVEGMWSWIGARAPEVEAVVWFGVSKEADWRLGPAARRAFLGREGR